jgi:hypothetical protein
VCINPHPGQFGTPSMVTALITLQIQYTNQQNRTLAMPATSTACRNRSPKGWGNAIGILQCTRVYLGHRYHAFP